MRRPLFLARAVYRRRRLRDGARLLPFVGLFLLLLPVLGRRGPGEAQTTVYIFIIWAFLILAAAMIAPGLSQPESQNDADPSAPPEDADAL